MTAAAGSPAAASGSALACFGVNGSATRLYYLDPNNHVNELAWNNGWSTTDMTAAAGSPIAASGSALACFGVNGSATRLYYLDSNSYVNELAWNSNWVNTDMTAAAGSPVAASGSPLACFGVNGTATRLYYLDGVHHVNEIAWDNKSAWQQYVVALFGNQIVGAVDNWPLSGPDLINDFFFGVYVANCDDSRRVHNHDFPTERYEQQHHWGDVPRNQRSRGRGGNQNGHPGIDFRCRFRESGPNHRLRA